MYAVLSRNPDPATLTGSGETVLASMSIYVFNTAYLAQRLLADAQRVHSNHDFGRDILPRPCVVIASAYSPSSTSAASRLLARCRDTRGLLAGTLELLSSGPPIDLRFHLAHMDPAGASASARLLFDTSQCVCATSGGWRLHHPLGDDPRFPCWPAAFVSMMVRCWKKRVVLPERASAQTAAAPRHRRGRGYSRGNRCRGAFPAHRLWCPKNFQRRPALRRLISGSRSFLSSPRVPRGAAK